MTEQRDRMPDFEPPSEEEGDHEQQGADAPSGADGAAGGDPRAPLAVGAADGDRTTRWRTRRRRVLDRARHPAVAFVAGLAVSAAVLTGVPALARSLEAGTAAELQRVVDEYVAAVERGDVAAAVALQPLDADEAGLDLIDGGAEPDVTPLLDCDAPSVDGDRSVMRCDITLSQYGTVEAARVVLEREGSWRVTSGLIRPSPVALPFGTVTSIGGVEVDGEALRDGEALWMLSGEYATTFTTSEDFESSLAGSDPRLVALDGGAWVTALLEPTEEVQRELDDAAVAYVAACSERYVEGCARLDPLAPGQAFAVIDRGGGYGPPRADEGFTQSLTVGRVGGPDAYDVTVHVALEPGDRVGAVHVSGGPS